MSSLLFVRLMVTNIWLPMVNVCGIVVRTIDAAGIAEPGTVSVVGSVVGVRSIVGDTDGVGVKVTVTVPSIAAVGAFVVNNPVPLRALGMYTVVSTTKIPIRMMMPTTAPQTHIVEDC
jgi:hypothetical protein